MSLLDVRDVSKRFGGVVAADKVSFSVAQDEIVGLVGPNGSGKSTLFDLITGFQPADAGRVFFQGEDTTGMAPHKMSRRGLARTFQRLRPFESMTVKENVAVSLLARGQSIERAHRMALETLQFVDLQTKADDAAGTLSTGQRKRLEVARALATDPKLLLMDEPAGGVDPERLREMVALIHRLRERGISLLIVEHNMRMIVPLANRLIVLDRGRKIAEGDPTHVIQEDRVVEAYLGRARPPGGPQPGGGVEPTVGPTS